MSFTSANAQVDDLGMERLPSEPASQLPSALPTDRTRRMTLTRLTGLADRFLVDNPADDTVLPALLRISDDPHLWGLLLGRAQRRVELGESTYLRLVEAARQAGADEQVAETHLRWLRATPGA